MVHLPLFCEPEARRPPCTTGTTQQPHVIMWSKFRQSFAEKVVDCWSQYMFSIFQLTLVSVHTTMSFEQLLTRTKPTKRKQRRQLWRVQSRYYGRLFRLSQIHWHLANSAETQFLSEWQALNLVYCKTFWSTRPTMDRNLKSDLQWIYCLSLRLRVVACAIPQSPRGILDANTQQSLISCTEPRFFCKSFTKMAKRRGSCRLPYLVPYLPHHPGRRSSPDNLCF